MSPSLSPALHLEIKQLIKQGKTQEAIKKLVQETSWGLKQAKDYVDQLATNSDQA
ncbi:MAG: hypothetical protein AAF399_16365 [Bacteroidota bacterium]